MPFMMLGGEYRRGKRARNGQKTEKMGQRGKSTRHGLPQTAPEEAPKRDTEKEARNYSKKAD
ncbi:hypothetical protein F383_16555 [Gossypium arboreum]|uniref:Uncharacterized protein n=1 Tax=Gossypium arboreum TaxID=29729 RepID=A0A0B0NEY1_GOSAR|nr:hypothetical protein F383_16555 [Gossypium arboreum]